jgi:hypothetical protein
VQDLRSNTSRVVHKEHGVPLSGVKFCSRQQLLFVAGTLTGKAFVYHLSKVPAAAAAAAASQGSSNSSSRVSSSAWQYAVSRREVLDLSLPGVGFINDVTLTPDRAYFTNSLQPVLHWVPRAHQQASAGDAAAGQQAAPRPAHKVHTGAFFDTQLGQFRANGIATLASSAIADTLLTANTHTGNLYRVVVSKAVSAAAPGSGAAVVVSSISSTSAEGGGTAAVRAATTAATGPFGGWAAALISGVAKQLGLSAAASASGVQATEVAELQLPAVPGGRVSKRLLVDGLWVADSSSSGDTSSSSSRSSPKSSVFVADNYNGRVWRAELQAQADTAALSCVWQGSALQVPTTLAMQAGRLWWVNAHLDTCFPFLPCPTHAFELQGVAPDSCGAWP